ncbi:MAG: hypothetical protein H0T73_22755 [Ardenticatenales bacterium]|nr:hypothetical protein [Ardenticatenales bacterium]
MSHAQVDLQRYLKSPYLRLDESKRGQADAEFAAAQTFLQQAESSFKENDEATGLKQAWAAMFRAARGLAYRAGYHVEQLRSLEVVLASHYPPITQDDITDLRRAQELLGPPAVAVERARVFIHKTKPLTPQAIDSARKN